MKAKQKSNPLLRKSSAKRYESKWRNKLLAECYLTIDALPIYNWMQLFKETDYAYLLKIKRTVKEKEKPVLNNLFTQLYDMYLLEFGLGEKLEESLRLKKNIIALRAQAIQNEDNSLNTIINIEVMKLNEIRDQHQEVNVWELKTRIEVALKLNIDVKKCSVIEFYNYMKLVEEINKAA